MQIKKNDKVMIITGKYAGKVETVLQAFPAENKIIVRDVNIITKHVKPRNNQQQGGRVEQEGKIDASNAMLYCSKCKRPTRVRSKVLEGGEKIRTCTHCGESLD